MKPLEFQGRIDIHTHSGNIDLYNQLQNRLPTTQTVTELSDKSTTNHTTYTVTFPFGTTEYYDINHFLRKKTLIPSHKEDFPYQQANQILLNEKKPNILPFLAIDPLEKVSEQLDFLQQNLGQFFGLKHHTHQTQSSALDLIGNKITEFAIDNNLPILIHSGIDASLHPKNIIKLAQTYPQLRVCIAHLAWFDNDSLEEVTKGDNIFIDCAPFSQLWERVRLGIIKTGRIDLIDRDSPSQSLINYGQLLTDHLLWGTDEPYTQVVKPDKNQSIIFGYTDEIRTIERVADNNLPIYDSITHVNPNRFLFG